MTEAATHEFAFIDLLEGVELQRIKENSLKFVGIDVETIKNVKHLKKDEFELKIRQFQTMSAEMKKLAYQSAVPDSTSQESWGVDGDSEQAVSKICDDSVLDKLDAMINMRYPTQTEKNEEDQDFTSITLKQPNFDFSHPSSDSIVQPTSPAFQEFQSETNILTDPTEACTSSFNDSRLRPLSGGSHHHLSILPIKKHKLDSIIDSDNFRPISSELHILTSEACLEF